MPKKISEAKAKQLIATANEKMNAALAVAGEIQREMRRGPAPASGLSASDWKKLGLPGTPPTTNNTTAATRRLELRLKRAANRLRYAHTTARLQRLGRQLNGSL